MDSEKIGDVFTHYAIYQSRFFRSGIKHSIHMRYTLMRNRKPPRIAFPQDHIFFSSERIDYTALMPEYGVVYWSRKATKRRHLKVMRHLMMEAGWPEIKGTP